MIFFAIRAFTLLWKNFSRSSAGRQIHPEEDIQFDQRGKDQKYQIHNQTGGAHLAIQLEFIARECQI